MDGAHLLVIEGILPMPPIKRDNTIDGKSI